VIESFVKLDLAGKISEILYLPDAYEFTQGFMNQALFCPRRTDGKSLIEQVIIDDDIGSHSVSPHCVYDAYHTHQGCFVNMNVVDGFVDRVPGLPFACHKGGEGGSGSRSIPENILLDLSKKFEQNLFSGPRHILEWNERVRPILDDYVKEMKAKNLPGEEALKFAQDYLKANQK